MTATIFTVLDACIVSTNEVLWVSCAQAGPTALTNDYRFDIPVVKRVYPATLEGLRQYRQEAEHSLELICQEIAQKIAVEAMIQPSIKAKIITQTIGETRVLMHAWDPLILPEDARDPTLYPYDTLVLYWRREGHLKARTTYDRMAGEYTTEFTK